MKKSRQKPQQKRKTKAADTPKAPARRDFMRMGRNLAIAVPIVGLGGFFAVRKVQADMFEADLTRIGQGVASVVQIHDPQCPLCATLQRQTRSALSDYADTDVTFLVANITTVAGEALAGRFGVGHVTLLLFSPSGEMTGVVRGPIDSDILKTQLDAHVGAYL